MSKFIKFLSLVLVAFGMASVHASEPSGYRLQKWGSRVTFVAEDKAQILRTGSYLPYGEDPIIRQNDVSFRPKVQVPTPTGGNLPAVVDLPIKKSAIAKALGRSLPIIGTALAIKDFLNDSGLILNQDGTIYNPQSEPPEGSYVSIGLSVIWNNSTYYSHSAFCQGAILFYQQNGYPSASISSCSDLVTYWRLDFNTGFGYTTFAQANSVSPAPACPSGYLVVSGICSPSAQSGPMTEQQIEDYINTLGNLSPSVIAAIREALLLSQGARDAINESSSEPDISFPGGSKTATVGDPKVTTRDYSSSDGTPYRETKTQTITAAASGDQISYTTNTTTQVTNLVTNQTTTTESTSGPKTSTTPDDGEDLECGLPGTPACKIDETGTPDPIPETQAQQDADNALSDTKEFFDGLQTALPELPSLNWTFSLPTGCSTIDMPGFSADVPSLGSINMCQYQPMVHDLMSMIWAGVGLFVAIGMVFKESTGKA